MDIGAAEQPAFFVRKTSSRKIAKNTEIPLDFLR